MWGWEHLDIPQHGVVVDKWVVEACGCSWGCFRAFFYEVGDWEGGGGVSPWSKDWYGTMGCAGVSCRMASIGTKMCVMASIGRRAFPCAGGASWSSSVVWGVRVSFWAGGGVGGVAYRYVPSCFCGSQRLLQPVHC